MSPTHPPRPCAWPGCGEYAEPGAQYCAAHRRAAWRDDTRARGHAAARGYDRRWRRLRLMVLRRQPLCADPFGLHAARGEVVPATEVDHIVPLADGGTNAVENLQPLCRECHARKTARERRGWRQIDGEGGSNR